MGIRIDLLIFGYRKINVSETETSRAASILLRSKIPTKINSDGSFLIRERDASRLAEAFSGVIEYETSEPLGLYGRYLRLKDKWLVFSAIGLCLVLTFLSGLLVWDVRIEGNQNIPAAAIEYALSESGLSVGSLWHSLDKNDVERNLLELDPSLSWVNINRRGSVAYVKVAEKAQNGQSSEETKHGYANVVASCDCVIEEITVTSGVAVVKRGDTVKAGDLLISGVINTENGGALCYAEGKVIGRVSDRVTVEIEREYEVRSEKSEKLLRCDIKIFDFAINIFKRYRNFANECDIIEDVKVFSLFGKCRLPIKTVSAYEVEYNVSRAAYSDTQLVSVASSRLNSATLKRLVDADLVKIKTDGMFTDKGYLMYSDIEFACEVGLTSPFESE